MLSRKPNPNPDLNIRVIDSGIAARVALSARLSIDTSPHVRGRLLAILGQKLISAVTIDMAELHYMDCSGLATMVESLKIARVKHHAALYGSA
jgi:anti-anti-sigma factor